MSRPPNKEDDINHLRALARFQEEPQSVMRIDSSYRLVYANSPNKVALTGMNIQVEILSLNIWFAAEDEDTDPNCDYSLGNVCIPDPTSDSWKRLSQCFWYDVTRQHEEIAFIISLDFPTRTPIRFYESTGT